MAEDQAPPISDEEPESGSRRTGIVLVVLALLVAAGIGLWAFTAEDDDEVETTDATTSTATVESTTTTDATTSTAREPTTEPPPTTEPASDLLVLTPDGLGPLTIGMSLDDAAATGLIGPDEPGCELAGPGERFAPLTGDGIAGGASFSDGELYAIRLRTGSVIEPGATVGMLYPDLLAAIDADLEPGTDAAWQAELDTSTEEVFGIWIISLTATSGGGTVDLIVDPASERVDEASSPRAVFCE